MCSKRIVAGKHIVKKWLVNGQARDVFHAHWIKTSSGGPYSSGISNSSGLPDGKWKFQVTRGKTIVEARHPGDQQQLLIAAPAEVKFH